MHHVATALTVYGIETLKYQILNLGAAYERVVTALTVYGIETELLVVEQQVVVGCNSIYRLRY